MKPSKAKLFSIWDGWHPLDLPSGKWCLMLLRSGRDSGVRLRNESSTLRSFSTEFRAWNAAVKLNATESNEST